MPLTGLTGRTGSIPWSNVTVGKSDASTARGAGTFEWPQWPQWAPWTKSPAPPQNPLPPTWRFSSDPPNPGGGPASVGFSWNAGWPWAVWGAKPFLFPGPWWGVALAQTTPNASTLLAALPQAPTIQNQVNAQISGLSAGEALA